MEDSRSIISHVISFKIFLLRSLRTQVILKVGCHPISLRSLQKVDQQTSFVKASSNAKYVKNTPKNKEQSIQDTMIQDAHQICNICDDICLSNLL